jgi:hypothetical protein
VALLKGVLWKDVVEEGFDGVWLFSTIRERRVIPLAVRTTRMWEYAGPMDPDRVSPKEVPDDEVSSWMELVLKVGTQQTVGGPNTFDKEHPSNLVSFFPLYFS